MSGIRGSAHCGPFARGVGRVVLKLTGWRTEGEVPEGSYFVVIAAPHTSNWDLIHMLAGCWSRGIRLSWMGKHTLFEGPFGWLMRAVGGVPIDRRKPGGVVAQMAQLFATIDEIALAIPPSGTRKRTAHWKSGFYHIARATGAPIVACFLDYARRVAGIGPIVHATEDMRATMDKLRSIYEGVAPRHAELLTPIRLAEEDA